MKEYNDKTILVLELLGFKHTTHVLWQHRASSMIVSVETDCHPTDLVEILMGMGASEVQSQIKSILDL